MSVVEGKRKKHKKSKNIITFDEEFVPKEKAKLILENELKSSLEVNDTREANNKKNKKAKISKTVEDNIAFDDDMEIQHETFESTKTKNKKLHKKKKKDKTLVEDTQKEVETVNSNKTQSTPKKDKEESNRAKKRKKHEQLLLEKKFKSEVAMQNKCLNYLSLWKHNRQEWKFEKLRQIWLQQNMFDRNKVPNEFWETLIEYFSSAKGKIRKIIMDEALQIIKEAENKEETEDNEASNVDDETDGEIKISRARTVLQYLQE